MWESYFDHVTTAASAQDTSVRNIRKHSPGIIQHNGGQVLTGLGEVGHGQAEGGQKATLRVDTGQSGYHSREEATSVLGHCFPPKRQ